MRLMIGLFSILAAACSAPTQVFTTDLTRQDGLYVVGYVDRDDIRAKLEDQFVDDLGAQEMRAVASRHDLPDIKRRSPKEIVAAANEHAAAAIVVINRVNRDGSGSVVESDQTIRPDNPDFEAFYETTRAETDTYGADDPVFAEVNAFLVDGTNTRRLWTGTTWAFDEGDEDQIISGISKTIAVELANARDELRNYSRPMD